MLAYSCLLGISLTWSQLASWSPHDSQAMCAGRCTIYRHEDITLGVVCVTKWHSSLIQSGVMAIVNNNYLVLHALFFGNIIVKLHIYENVTKVIDNQQYFVRYLFYYYSNLTILTP